jgi:hypothetical protein
MNEKYNSNLYYNDLTHDQVISISNILTNLLDVSVALNIFRELFSYSSLDIIDDFNTQIHFHAVQILIHNSPININLLLDLITITSKLIDQFKTSLPISALHIFNRLIVIRHSLKSLISDLYGCE